MTAPGFKISTTSAKVQLLRKVWTPRIVSSRSAGDGGQSGTYVFVVGADS